MANWSARVAPYPSRGAGGMLAFLSGYLAIWAVFSLVATLVQAGLASVDWMSDMYMNVASRWLGVAVLLAAGLYQLTPVKAACLQSCRSPAEALTCRRRTGRFASFRMGTLHGRYCVGCCWALMALLFVGGIMNLWWILGLAGIVAVEKLTPAGERTVRILGIGLVLGAGLMALWASRLV